MKNNYTRLVLCVLVGSLVVFAAKVTTDYNHAADFSQYKTYSWLSVQAGDPLWTDHIRAAVNAQFAAKGWAKVADGDDAAVAAFGSTHEQPRLETFYEGFGGGWFWRGRGGTGLAVTTVDSTPVGALVVDLFDMPTKKLVWRGVANDALSDKPEKNEKKLEKAVGEMFDHFPPKSKG